MDILKFTDLTVLSALCETQIQILEQIIEFSDSEEIVKFNKGELRKLKSTNNKLKKLIASY